MADGIPPRTGDMDEPPQQPGQAEPPPLDSIRVKGQRAKGLNKPAILIATASGVAVVLVLASGALTTDPARKPAEVKPMMSDPARPEMAKGAIRNLPADYTQVAIPPALKAPAGPPQLGPPLPGDIAAFGQTTPQLRTYSEEDAPAWSEPAPYASAAPPDPREAELIAAERSAIFFAVRSQGAGSSPAQGPPTQQTPTLQPSSSRLTTFAPQPSSTTPASPSADRALFPGAVISASLVTELNSESPGPVIAQITQAIYDSATGRTLVIPQGARLIGEYKSSTRYGQSRVAIVWGRLIMPDGIEIALGEVAASPNGAAGVGGEVDDHWGDVFGAAALGTLINVGVATTEEPQITFSGIGAVSRDPVDQALQDGIQRSASTVTNRVVDRGLSLPPTIRVPAGTKLTVIVTRRSSF